MGKTIEIRLSDAQHAALSAEATASGNSSFFGYCREKLMAGTEIKRKPPVLDPIVPNEFPVLSRVPQHLATSDYVEQVAHVPLLPADQWINPPTAPTDDRLSRIEDAVARLTDFVLSGQRQPPAVEPQQQSTDPIDIDDMVSRQVAEAEAQGLTEHIPDQADIEMQHAGVRPLSKRPMKFASASVPRHLQDVL